MSMTLRLSQSRIFSHSASRFLLPVVIVVVLRIFCATILYTFLSPAASVRSTLNVNGFYIFSAWDSGHFDLIAHSWYPSAISPEWEYSPLYPALIRILAMFGFSVPAGAFLVATATGLASIVVFQKIACTYLKQAQALQATLAYFLFPPIFVFSAVSYSEPVFLFFSLLAWYYHIKKKDWQSCVAATLSTLARPIGVFIIIPLGYQYLRTRQYGKLAYCTVPVITVTGWITYSFFMTGTLAALKANGIYWRTEYFALVEETIQESLQGHAGVAVSKLLEYAHEHVITLVVSLASLVIVAALALRVMKIDRALGVYTIMLVGGILCVLPTSFGSFPRYLAFIFPIGLALHTKKMKVAIFLLIILALLDYLAWYAFLTYSFASV